MKKPIEMEDTELFTYVNSISYDESLNDNPYVIEALLRKRNEYKLLPKCVCGVELRDYIHSGMENSLAPKTPNVKHEYTPYKIS